MQELAISVWMLDEQEDAHLDTWPAYPGPGSEQSRITHGTFFYLAKEEGLMTNTSIHAGIRCKLAVSPLAACCPPFSETY